MPSGYPYSKSVRPELFDRVCGGAPPRRAAQDLGVHPVARGWSGEAASWLDRRGGQLDESYCPPVDN